MLFHWSLGGSKSPQASRTLLSILVNLNNAEVWMVVLNDGVGLMVSTRPVTSKSPSPFNNPLVIVPKAPITIGIIVTFMFHSFFFNSLARSRYFFFFFTFFRFYSVVSRDSKVDNFANSLFFLLLIINRPGLLAEIRWSVCTSKSHWSLCVSFSRTGTRVCIYHLFVWSKLNFLHISQWITLPTQSWQVLYSFYANLLHSLIMWLMVSSLSSHTLLLFCCVLSILALICFVLTALFCAAIRRDSVSLLKYPFLSQVQFFSCEMLFISRLKHP